MVLAIATWAVLQRVPAPFGRHASGRWGPTVDTRAGWIAMELPSLAIMGWFALATPPTGSAVWVLFGLWLMHYVNRTLVYPFRIRPAATRMPLVIVISAIAFNVVNAGLNGYYLATHADDYAAGWLRTPHFWIGLTLFALGACVNLRSDAMLIALRSGGEQGYRIPRGFLFEYVSSPNLFGEIVEWAGFALMAWNGPALSFFVWTCANLLPRAKNHHDWYRARFPDYPPGRRAVIPLLY
jgi:hypothetical protein